LSEELSVAYAEIEELKTRLASLEDADIFSETVSSVSDKLTDVLKMLVQCLISTESSKRSLKSTKLSNPPILTNRVDPLFDI
jgi:hypothetical protein